MNRLSVHTVVCAGALAWLQAVCASAADSVIPVPVPAEIPPPSPAAPPAAVVPPPAAGELARLPVPAVKLLSMARRPFLEPEWCRFKGEIRYRGKDLRQTVPVTLAMRLSPERLDAELVLDGGRPTRISQVYKPDGTLPEVTLALPPAEKKGALTLTQLGLQPEDLTFCFLYWNFVQELEPDSVRGQACRVLELVHPQKFEKVRVWMLKEHAFPLRVQWFLPGEVLYYRQLEFSDFKKNDNFWYPTGLLLSGNGWKSQVTFAETEAARPADKPEPADLFRPAGK